MVEMRARASWEQPRTSVFNTMIENGYVDTWWRQHESGQDHNAVLLGRNENRLRFREPGAVEASRARVVDDRASSLYNNSAE